MSDPRGKSAQKQLDSIIFSPVFYLELQVPNGYLSASRQSHALWHYYIYARNTYESLIENPFVLVGDKDPEYNFAQLFTSIAQMYHVSPGEMQRCWPEVDMQCCALHLPLLPLGEKYRHDDAMIIQ